MVYSSKALDYVLDPIQIDKFNVGIIKKFEDKLTNYFERSVMKNLQLYKTPTELDIYKAYNCKDPKTPFEAFGHLPDFINE